MFERFEYSSPERPGRRLHYAQMLAGRVWSPLAGTPPALLLELADSFVDLCHSRTPFEQQSAIQQAARTLDKLAAERAGGR
jgi:hypothetical protein